MKRIPRVDLQCLGTSNGFTFGPRRNEIVTSNNCHKPTWSPDMKRYWVKEISSSKAEHFKTETIKRLELKQKCKEFDIKYGPRNLNDVLYPFEDTLKERESSKTLDFMHTFKKRLEILEIICGLVFIE